jgi:hypothetical protein
MHILALPLLLAAAPAAPVTPVTSGTPGADKLVAIRAGTIHLVDGGRVLT